MLAYLVTNDFAFKASNDGKIIEIDRDAGVAIIEYTDGSKDVIDLTQKQSRNTGTGYWITNTLVLTDGLKVGSKFKKNDILAYNRNFFKHDKIRGGFQHMPGRLSRVAIACGPFTHEDSSAVSEKFTSDMETDITMERTVDMPLTVNITKIVKLGDRVRAGDALITFEEAADQSTADFIKILGDDLGDTIAEFAANKITTKVSGEIVGLRVYHSKPLSELSKPLQKIIKSIQEPMSSYNNAIFRHFGQMPKSTRSIDDVDEDDVDNIDANVVGVNTDESVVQENFDVAMDLKHALLALPDVGRRHDFIAGNKYSCVIAPADQYTQMEIMNWVDVHIDPNDIDEVDGVEENSHVTLMYGLIENQPNPYFETLCRVISPMYINPVRLGVFRNETQDVLFIEFDNTECMSAAREWIMRCMPYALSREGKYIPHMTIAYLKPGCADKYLDKPLPKLPHTIAFKSLCWQHRRDTLAEYPLTGDVVLGPGSESLSESTGARKALPPVPDSVDIRYSGYVPADVKISKGNQMQGIRISFMIKFSHRVGVGDKIAFYAALKSVVCTVMENGEEPYYIDPRGNIQPVDAVTSPFGILNRKTQDITAAMALGMLLVEMKYQISQAATKHGLKHKLRTV
jgi:2'-5' RNA ligase